jgi:uncharacterized repeat protein (TIGR04076 family)
MVNTRQGETFTLGARTPEGKGMCTNALNAIHPMTFALRLTDKIDWEKKDHFDMICPHGAVTNRMTRVRE